MFILKLSRNIFVIFLTFVAGILEIVRLGGRFSYYYGQQGFPWCICNKTMSSNFPKLQSGFYCIERIHQLIIWLQCST